MSFLEAEGNAELEKVSFEIKVMREGGYIP